MHVVIIGGGVSGVSCAEELARLRPAWRITLVSASPVLKGITNLIRITDNIESFDVKERPLQSLAEAYPNVGVMLGAVDAVDEGAHVVTLEGGKELRYDLLCVCSGARPRVLCDHPHVLGVRDTETVEDICCRLRHARRVVVVGNGGIALEFVHAVDFCDVVWVIKDAYVGNTFFDATASQFFLDSKGIKRSSAEDAAASGSGESAVAALPRQRAPHPSIAGDSSSSPSAARAVPGNALGPKWTTMLRGVERPDPGAAAPCLRIERQAEVVALRERGQSVWQPVAPVADAEASDGPADSTPAAPPVRAEEAWPLWIRLSNGKEIGCDFILSGTGVEPYAPFLRPGFPRAEDGGILVDVGQRAAGHEHVYVAGDACTVTGAESPCWFQMRLWSQARLMGLNAALHMAGEADELNTGMSFELFAHVTRMFGFKVVLLGRFNGQGLGQDYERVIKQREVSTAGVAALHGTGPADGEAAASSDAAPKLDVEVLVRSTPGVEYVKLVVHHGRVVGAMLIGDTDLEETFENLILNQLDVSAYGEHLLDPDVDIEDYFD